MKFQQCRKIFLAISGIAFFIVAVFFVFVIFIRYALPNAVSYSVSVSQTETADSCATIEKLSDNISEITAEGPFIIKSSDNRIFVYSDNKKLYCIKKLLSELPETDQKNIHAGIYAESRNSLAEIVSFIES